MRKVFIIILVTATVVVVAAIGVLIWWLVAGRGPFIVDELEGDGLGDIEFTAAFTRIRRTGDMFWWFYPSLATNPNKRPTILWLDGVTGVPPSLLANFGMFGPYDFNLNKREDSWVDEYNLLFIDAPLGTGFSTAEDDSAIPKSLDENADHLLFALESFYILRNEYVDSPLYIFGQGDGSQLALSLAIRLYETSSFSHNLKGVVIGNGIISPALVLSKLGFYLEELGYIDANGRDAIEKYANETNTLVDEGKLDEAYDNFLALGDFVNENAGAVAVNLGYIIDKLTQETSRDYFKQRKYLEDLVRSDIDFYKFMEETVAPALGINNAVYDSRRETAVEAVRDSYMKPASDKVEYILQNININVTIYNGNLDAVSNTPGQLEWVENLQWDGQDFFLNSTRNTLIVNRFVEGYFQETEKLHFYWINAAGQSVPLDNPSAIRRVLQRITTGN